MSVDRLILWAVFAMLAILGVLAALVELRRDRAEEEGFFVEVVGVTGFTFGVGCVYVLAMLVFLAKAGF